MPLFSSFADEASSYEGASLLSVVILVLVILYSTYLYCFGASADDIDADDWEIPAKTIDDTESSHSVNPDLMARIAVEAAAKGRQRLLPKFRNLFLEGLGTSPATRRQDDFSRIASFALANGRVLTVVRGSYASFASSCGAIVNPARELVIGGGTGSRPLVEKGGHEYNMACNRIPLLNVGPSQLRCATGEAFLMVPSILDDLEELQGEDGANQFCFGTLETPYIIHAVGPDYSQLKNRKDPSCKALNVKLYSAYKKALDAAAAKKIKQVCFPLISCGDYIGTQHLSSLLKIGIQAIADWSKYTTFKLDVEDIVVVGASWKEVNTIMSVCDKQFANEGCLKVVLV